VTGSPCVTAADFSLSQVLPVRPLRNALPQFANIVSLCV
jgi:hypothetical protein